MVPLSVDAPGVSSFDAPAQPVSTNALAPATAASLINRDICTFLEMFLSLEMFRLVDIKKVNEPV
jgi:hypothetical protein